LIAAMALRGWSLAFILANYAQVSGHLGVGFGSAEGKALSMQDVSAFEGYVVECTHLPSVVDTTTGLGGWLLWASLKKMCEAGTQKSFSLANDGELVSQFANGMLTKAKTTGELEQVQMQGHWGHLVHVIAGSRNGSATLKPSTEQTKSTVVPAVIQPPPPPPPPPPISPMVTTTKLPEKGYRVSCEELPGVPAPTSKYETDLQKSFEKVCAMKAQGSLKECHKDCAPCHDYNYASAMEQMSAMPYDIAAVGSLDRRLYEKAREVIKSPDNIMSGAGGLTAPSVAPGPYTC
jgi:hypothetical protein